MSTEKLETTLATVRTRIEAAKSPGAHRMTEEETKVTLINPVLRALGWDVEDVEQVRFEFKVKRMDRPVDYALLLRRSPRLLVEAKAIGQNVEDHKWAAQIMSYAGVVGAPWIALTNGDAWRVYKAGVALPLDDKLFRAFSVGDDGAADTLALLARESLKGSTIDEMWDEERVDRQVEKAVEDLFDPGGDLAVVNQIKRRTDGLTAGQIKASLYRARVSIEFPPKPPPIVPPITPPPGPGASDTVTVADLVRAGLLKPPAELHKSYKGTDLRATIEADGRIRVGGELVDSPSAAGGIAMAIASGKRGGKPLACAGWHFWRTGGPDGGLLDDLRQEYLARHGGRHG